MGRKELTRYEGKLVKIDLLQDMARLTIEGKPSFNYYGHILEEDTPRLLGKKIEFTMFEYGLILKDIEQIIYISGGGGSLSVKASKSKIKQLEKKNKK